MFHIPLEDPYCILFGFTLGTINNILPDFLAGIIRKAAADIIHCKKTRVGECTFGPVKNHYY